MLLGGSKLSGQVESKILLGDEYLEAEKNR
jgi:hypothetical protein